MHASRRSPTPVPITGAPPLNLAQAAVAPGEIALIERVGRVLQNFAAARVVGDDEILQHARDCTSLMDTAYGRYIAHGTVHDREDALLWMHRRDEALRSLSPGWKAAREAEIQRAIGADHFLEQGEVGRARMTGGRD